MMRSPFPPYVGFAVKTLDDLDGYCLSPEEAALLNPRAGKKRRDEFALGRAACLSALQQVGFRTPPPVLKGPRNEPLWPFGYVGAITHAAEIAVCAVCPAHKARGIGVDLEDIKVDVSEDVYHLVCTEEELAWVEEDRGSCPVRFNRVFSAKEAAFKAFFTRAQVYLNFMDATLVWDEEKELFQGVLLQSAGDAYSEGYRFEVGSKLVQGLVFSFILLLHS